MQNKANYPTYLIKNTVLQNKAKFLFKSVQFIPKGSAKFYALGTVVPYEFQPPLTSAA
jgi:hypothetical protein